MVFEVDNTTEQLIYELQKSIEDTIAVLENGQRDLRGLIEAAKNICEDAATADQADAISKQLSGLKEEQRKAATAQQIKDLGAAMETVRGQTQQEMNEMAVLKEGVTELCQSIQTNQRTMLNAQKEAQDQLVRQLSEQADRSEAGRLHSLEELSHQLMELSSSLAERLDTLVSSSSSAAKTAAENQVMLAAITAYLSLPGYKRFFRGMEVIQHETAQ